jgi:hypothetical protein
LAAISKCDPVIDEKEFENLNGPTPTSNPKMISSLGSKRYGETEDCSVLEFNPSNAPDANDDATSPPTERIDLAFKFGVNLSMLGLADHPKKSEKFPSELTSETSGSKLLKLVPPGQKVPSH